MQNSSRKLRHALLLFAIASMAPVSSATTVVATPQESQRFVPQALQPAVVNGNPTAKSAPMTIAPVTPTSAPAPNGAIPGSVRIPTPNISGAQSQTAAQQIIESFLGMMGGKGSPPPKTLPNGQPNPAYAAWAGLNPSTAPYTGRYGAPAYSGKFPGLSNLHIANTADAVRFLNGHTCNANDTDRLVCMVCNIMFEAGNQPDEGQVAVGRSVMTRAFSASYPDTVCKVVYQRSATVAQYSWTLENKDHTLHASPTLDRAIQNAIASLKQGPNGLTNYFAWKLVNPQWAHDSQCAATTTRIYDHQFCTINGTPSLTVAQYAQAEGLSVDEVQMTSTATK